MRKALPESRVILRRGLPLFAALTLTVSFCAQADDYATARAELVAAYQAEDYAAMRDAALNSLNARPAYPGALFNLALAEYLDGELEASLGVLTRLRLMNVDFAATELDEFAGLHDLPGWEDYVASVAELYEPSGDVSVAYRHEDPGFVPEGIAAGADESLYLGSIRHGAIVRIGATTETVLSAGAGLQWSVFGMRMADDGRLWFVTSAIEQFAALQAEDAGKNSLVALDTATGEVVVRAPLPASDGKQVLGDLILQDKDTILLADQADGVVYRYSISSGEYTTLIERGSLTSPQGLVLDETGNYLYLADYVGGLYRFTLADGTLQRVAPLQTASNYGIDGLYRYEDRLLAIQNGIRPHRVVEFSLGEDGLSIASARVLAANLEYFDEPNLGVVRGDEFLFIANSHWNRFDENNELPEDLEGPVVLSIDLAKN